MDYKDVITKVKSSYDIVEYLKNSGLQLKPNGTNVWKVCCPFHNEKTPSFVVNEAFQNYHCFGCGVSGDILSFVMKYENLTFADCISKLAQEKNIQIELDDNENNIDYNSLYNILRETALLYCKEFDKLDDTHAVKKEIADRGLSYNNKNKENIKYGYSPSGNKVYQMLKSKGFSDELIELSGVCRKNKEYNNFYDFFRSRLMFIITDRYNKPIGFSSRKIFDDDNRGKYVNSSDSPLFHKSKVLYNHYLARKYSGDAKKIYIVEGQFDVAAFVEAGLKNVVASSGTAFTKEHIKECLKMTGNNQLVFCFDGDEAGLNAAQKIFIKFPEAHENSFVVIFPDNEDPCDYRLKNGNEQLKDFVENSKISLVEFMIKRIKEKYNINDLIERSKYLTEAASVIKLITNRSLRDQCIKTLSIESLTSIEDIRNLIQTVQPYQLEEPYDNSENDNVQKTIEIIKNNTIVDKEKDLDNTIVDLNNLKSLMESNSYYRLSVFFINLGLSRAKWRKHVVRSYSYLPKEFLPFLRELKKVEDRERIFPELFTDMELVEFLMDDSFSQFYNFMSDDELKSHFIYLHDCLISMKDFNKKQKKRLNVIEMLNNSGNNTDTSYFKEIFEKSESV